MITWQIHTDSYGNDLYTFDTWRLLEDDRPISPWIPSEALNVGPELMTQKYAVHAENLAALTFNH